MTRHLLTFEDNGRAHGDLLLHLEGFERRCDSYYFALDGGVLPGREDAEKVRQVLRQLLRGWRAAVVALKSGEVALLPYEFDDECSGWLRVSIGDDDTVEVLPVWSRLEGWAFYPSSFEESLDRIGPTTPVWSDLPPQLMTRGQILASIDSSIAGASPSQG